MTQNLPILTTLRSWKYGFNSPFKCDVYYINTRLFTGNKWGTSNPIMMRDKDFGVIRLRAILPNADGFLRPGMFGRIEVVYDQRADALTVPRSALLEGEGETAVYVVREGKATRLPVRASALPHRR